VAVERAEIEVVRKPWGCADLRPWSGVHDADGPVGELWFQRSDRGAPPTALLLKLLFTTQPLSIQVHPDDAFARSLGLDHGKTEAWLVLSAEPGAVVGVGLKSPASLADLRASIDDGSIIDRMRWREVQAGDVVSVPAGTIHAIGAGLVIAEIQQRSDATFRLFDYGRARDLHVDHALAVAHRGPAEPQPPFQRLTDERTLLAASPSFVLESLTLPDSAGWTLRATGESWLLVLQGQARVGALTVGVGEAVFLDGAQADLSVGAEGVTALLAYVGTVSDPALLFNRDGRQAVLPLRILEAQP
jgi:mannose-6-phosphate isomerase